VGILLAKTRQGTPHARQALVTYIWRHFDMRNTIPAGTLYFKSQIGTYNFLYPAEERTQLDEDVEILSTPQWPRMAGVAAYHTAIGVIWCEPGVVQQA